MIFLIVLAAAVAAVDLLLLLPIRLSARCTAGAFSLRVCAGPVPIGRLPGKRAGTGRRSGGGHARRRIPLTVLARALRRCQDRLRRTVERVRLDSLRLHFTAGGDDPCRTAMAYAGAGAALEWVRGLLGGRVGREALQVRADFTGGPTVLDGGLDATVRLGTLLAAAVCFGTALLREYSRYQRGRE